MMRRIAYAGLAALCFSGNPAAAAGPQTLQAVLADLDHDPHRDLHAVIVRQDGKTLAERYFNGGDAHTRVDVRSAGKSVTSLLMGIALDQGAIATLDDPVQAYWPEAAGSPVGHVPLRDLLTMRTGLAADDDIDGLPGNEDAMDAADDPHAFVLAVPRLEPPGTRYRYNSLATYVAGIVIARATGQSLASFARVELFAPLGIQAWDWQQDRAGETKGQGNLFLTARDFARLGDLVLHGGVHDGRQIVSRRWIEDSLHPRVDIAASDPFADGYGYFWYRQRHPVNGRQVEVFFASGNGGNKLYVIPELAMVVTIVSRAYNTRHGQRRSEAILRSVLAVVADAVDRDGGDRTGDPAARTGAAP